MNRNRNEFYRFRGDTPPTEASRASILEPAIEGTVAELYLYDLVYYDEQMANSALAHFLNLGKQTGSWALGTFADFFALADQTTALQIADTANQHIVEDLVDLNWGEGEPARRIVFDEIWVSIPADG